MKPNLRMSAGSIIEWELNKIVKTLDREIIFPVRMPVLHGFGSGVFNRVDSELSFRLNDLVQAIQDKCYNPQE
jgi:hypothetical protein